MYKPGVVVLVRDILDFENISKSEKRWEAVFQASELPLSRPERSIYQI